MGEIETFRQHIIEDKTIFDPDGLHHEFVSGVHGQKLDFDKIADGSGLYSEWVVVSADDVAEQCPELPSIILGVANGTNRLAVSVAENLSEQFKQHRVAGLVSAKRADNDKVLYLPDRTAQIITDDRPDLLVVVEDAGTKGTNSVQIAEQALLAGAKNVIVQVTWQRNMTLPRLDELRAKYPDRFSYHSIIKHLLPDYEPEVCRTDPAGFCNRGWGLIERKRPGIT